MDYKLMAKEILEHIGGAENVANMTHCATRLRLTLKDTSKADDEAVKGINGVINVVNKAGQYQLLIGTEVPKLMMNLRI
ncbi:PTS transporter subunit EIIB [Listeria booriae]|uniref:PTS transporter subunit EIIB n=1 Tax=Listeria booriae TaxID=1552123 RepID=UPI001C9D333C|nr:PTS transporter subunit EIIB [Listeria booriae]